MNDVFSPEVRSRVMSGIRSGNTKPEMVLRSALHRRGLRFRLHDRKLPGKPDLVFPKHRAVLFAHGCFWHLHECHLFRWPKSRKEFWHTKLLGNRRNDVRKMLAITLAGWRVGIVWECALKGRLRLELDAIADQCAAWIRSGEQKLEIAGYRQGE